MANDGAAEIALGGIRLKQERRVAMVKERLCISKKKVRVEYEFLNESKEDVTTEVAFPIPDYEISLGLGWAPFEEFLVEVDGKRSQFLIEATGWIRGQDITPILKNLGVRVETFGDWKMGTTNRRAGVTVPATSQFHCLPDEQLKPLVASGLLEDQDKNSPDGLMPNWTVRKTYHWTQTFPAGVTVRVAHEYTPATGSANQLTFADLEHPRPREDDYRYNQSAESGCIDASQRKSLSRAVELRNQRNPKDAEWRKDSFTGDWVRYILTTANTWKTPIRDFELIVERDPGEFVTFCWDGPVEKTGANTFRAQMKDFVPNKELTVYFLQP
jgi:hypothetical protein